MSPGNSFQGLQLEVSNGEWHACRLQEHVDRRYPLKGNVLPDFQRSKNTVDDLVVLVIGISLSHSFNGAVHNLMNTNVDFSFLSLQDKQWAPLYLQTNLFVFNVLSHAYDVVYDDEVGVIGRSRRLRLITLTKSNDCFIIHWTEKKMATTVSGTDNL